MKLLVEDARKIPPIPMRDVLSWALHGQVSVVDLHAHPNCFDTEPSADGKSQVSHFIRIMNERSIDAVFETGHNRVPVLGRSQLFPPGMEPDTKQGHLLMWGIDCALAQDIVDVHYQRPSFSTFPELGTLHGMIRDAYHLGNPDRPLIGFTHPWSERGIFYKKSPGAVRGLLREHKIWPFDDIYFVEWTNHRRNAHSIQARNAVRLVQSHPNLLLFGGSDSHESSYVAFSGIALPGMQYKPEETKARMLGADYMVYSLRIDSIKPARGYVSLINPKGEKRIDFHLIEQGAGWKVQAQGTKMSTAFPSAPYQR